MDLCNPWIGKLHITNQCTHVDQDNSGERTVRKPTIVVWSYFECLKCLFSQWILVNYFIQISCSHVLFSLIFPVSFITDTLHFRWLDPPIELKSVFDVPSYTLADILFVDCSLVYPAGLIPIYTLSTFRGKLQVVLIANMQVMCYNNATNNTFSIVFLVGWC